MIEPSGFSADAVYLQEKERMAQAAIDELCLLVWDGKNDEAMRMLTPRMDLRIKDMNQPNSERGMHSLKLK
jgi:hypothetical protein